MLPSPPVGVPYTQPVDPPWMPKAKTKVEEVTINQEEVVREITYIRFDYNLNDGRLVTKRAVVTASKSRKKHQQEKIYKALEADQQNKKIARENYFFTNLNYLQHASFEPFLFQSKEEPEEGMCLLVAFFARSLSIQMCCALLFKNKQHFIKSILEVGFMRSRCCQRVYFFLLSLLFEI